MPLRLQILGDHPGLKPEHRVREFTGCGGTIGRAGDNDWVLPDDKRYVSSRHAVLDFQAGAYYLVDTSRNGVYVNGADTPVGTGHPQRIFDGDRLRIGEYTIKVTITGNDAELPDDGMRDSIVRAQLVREDPSEELLLVDESKLLMDSSFQRHITPADASAAGRTGSPRALRPSDAGGDVATKARPTPSGVAGAARQAGAVNARAAGARREPPTLATVVRQAPAAGGTGGISALLEGAGVRPEALAGLNGQEVLLLAGRLLRASVAGLMDLLKEKGQLLDAYRISQSAGTAADKNPLKFSPNVEEALRYLLADRGESGYLVAEDAIREALKDLRQHEQALQRALPQAARDFGEHFDPEELKKRFDRGLKRNGLLSSANKLKYWDLYEESYAALMQREEGAPPQLFVDEFARAYGEELDAARKTRR